MKPGWTLSFKESIVDDLRWFGKKNERILLDEAERIVAEDPLAVSRHMKMLRQNRVAQRELSPRSHAPRGNAVRDALRPWAGPKAATQSVEEGIPTQSVGTRVGRLLRVVVISEDSRRKADRSRSGVHGPP